MTTIEVSATVTTKGQVTIPVAVRKHLRVKPKDRVVFTIESGGAVHLSTPAYPDIASLRGAAGSLKQPMAWQDVLDTARDERARHKASGQ